MARILSMVASAGILIDTRIHNGLETHTVTGSIRSHDLWQRYQVYKLQLFLTLRLLLQVL